MKRLSVLLVVIVLFASTPGIAQTQTNAAGGAVELTVSLPNPQQKLLYVHEVMPVDAGPLTLYYPKYIPGDHAPDGPIGTMMGLAISANGKRIAWHRDDVDMFTFHLTVPTGVHRIDIRFEFPADGRATRNLLDLTWDHVALYRAGSPTKDQLYRPTLVIPADWRHASALTTESARDGRITFKPVPFNTLVDSPVIAGKYFREVDLTPPGSSVHRYLDLVGDDAAVLGISDREIAGYRKLVEQADALFHSHHYKDYHFLLVLSDYTSRGGLEHHQSSDDRSHIGAGMFADADHFMLSASFLPHEYVHSWNGKFMRPEKLWQPDFESPEHSRMLWMYESLTVYLGDVLTVRSGLWSPETWRQAVAYRAAVMAHQTGREWRPLIDTTVAAQLLYGSPKAWANRRRQTDFYREGEFLWLAVDTKIRQLSHDRHSLDDFAKRFFSRDNGSFVTHTYGFDDVVHALNAVQPYDWSGFLHNWLEGVDGEVPLLSGIDASGWRLAYTDRVSRFQNALENVGPGELSPSGVNAMFSVGLFLDHKGKIEDVMWDGPAFKAGLAPHMQIVSIDGESYSTAGLRADIARAKQTKKPLQIRVRADGGTETHTVDYFGGLKYPHLVRASGEPDYLKQILAPLPTSETAH
jgi:predicted metalloprotease with PDZ domain